MSKRMGGSAYVSNGGSNPVSVKDEIMDHTGHTRVDTLTRYIRNAKEIRTSAAAKLGL